MNDIVGTEPCPMSAFSIMAHSLHRELLARGIDDVPLTTCEEILRRVVDHAAAVASAKYPVPAAPADHPDRA
jgi:hypothetical protein